MNALFDSLRNIGPTRIAVIGAVTLVVLALLLYLVLQGRENLSLLYGNLNPEDSQQISTALSGRGVAFEQRNGGAEIWVPIDRVNELRVGLGQQGLPAGAASIGKGYELFDDQNALGTTNFVQRLNRLRALEGELQRTIKSMASIQNARVHLVLPERELFSRERQEARGSVVVQARGRQPLDDGEVIAIQQVVAAAVPALKPTRITITDDQGRVYASGIEDEEGLALQRAEQVRSRFEEQMRAKIEETLVRIVGAGNVRVQVSAEMDFNRETVNRDSFDPEGQVPRSVQEVEETEESTETEGEDPVTVATNLPDADTEISTGAGSFQRRERTETTTNFEITRVQSTSVRDTAVTTQLAVAVLVNGTYRDALDANGNAIQEYVPRSEEELTEFDRLVKSAIGFQRNPQRADEVSVVNLEFFRPDPFVEGEDTILGMPKDQFFQIIEILVLGLVAGLVILLVVRPLVARALEARDEAEGGVGAPALPERPGGPVLAGPDIAGRLDESAEMEALEQMIDINQVEGRVRASSLRKIGEIVDKHPEEAVAILRNWMYQEA